MNAFTVLTCDQRTEDWRAARLGRLTSSRAADMLSQGRSKSAESASRRNLRLQLALERIVGRSLEREYQTQAMADGIEREPHALRLYESRTGHLTKRAGFLLHTEHMAGASLDAYLGDFETVVEVKCPIAATHLDYLTTREIPSNYYAQILHQCWVSGARQAHFVSYCPDFPEHLQLLVEPFVIPAPAVEDYAKKAVAFLEEVAASVENVQSLRIA